MKRNRKPILFLVMLVALLFVVSSRVSPKENGKKRTEDAEEIVYTPTVTLPPETPRIPENNPGEPERIRDVLHDISLSSWNLKLVNNTNVLPSSFAPDVQKIRDDQYFDVRAAEPLEEMLKAAEAEGYTVTVRAAYRPFNTQAYIFNGRASQIQWGTDMSLMEAETRARKVVAYPGTSEHQLGLCVDLLDKADTSMDAEKTENLSVLIWLREHCAEYGFILRYPKDKQEITGWYEPWHFRYVGEDAAAYIMENGLCLEEFYDKY